MKTIISPAEAVSLGWGTGEYVSPEAVSESDIAAASRRYIEPVIGSKLAAALCEGRYEELRAEYVAPALAMYVRVSMQPSMDIRSGQAGSVVQSGQYADPASAEARRAALHSLRSRAGSLLRRLSDRLDAAGASFPEYVPEQNILKRCCADGGIVQVF